MKKNKLCLLSITILFSTPFVVKAEVSEINIALDKFFNHKINSLVFKQTPNIVIFESDIRRSGMTYIPNPFTNFRPIGPIDLVNIPARAYSN